jgi:hypothetical protein
LRTKKIPLTHGHSAIVDVEDFAALSVYYWQAHIQKHKLIYARRNSGHCKAAYMHREIMLAPKGIDVDHINGNGLDNRRSNLRLATRSQNLANRIPKKLPRSGFLGVRLNGKKWMANLRVGGKVIYLGSFKTREIARSEYISAHKKHHGEFSIYNRGE